MTTRCVFWTAESKRDPDQTQLPEEGDQCPHTEALGLIQELWQPLEARVDIFLTCLTSTGVTTGHKNINKSTGGLGDPVFPLELTRVAAWARPAMSREPWWPLKRHEHRSRVNQVSWAVSATLKKVIKQGILDGSLKLRSLGSGNQSPNIIICHGTTLSHPSSSFHTKKRAPSQS